MDCPSSVVEGGLVAQATYERCRHADDNLGRPYCEFRDGSGRDDWLDFDTVAPSREETAYITIDASSGGQWIIFASSTGDSRLLIKQGSSVRGSVDPMVQAGETMRIELLVLGRANYRKDGDGNGVILVGPPGTSSEGDAIASCDITVQDDDNSAYIGSRSGHPYGGTWQSTPHCYTPGCAN